MAAVKKIILVVLVLAFSHADLSASKSASSSSSRESLSTAAVGNPTCFTFIVLPKFMRRSANHNQIKLAATLAPLYNIPDAEIIAHCAKGYARFYYSRALRKFMRAFALAKEDFKPLEKHLERQLKKANKNILPFVSVLATYLQTGKAPVFTLSFER